MLGGLLASGIILLENPSWRLALLLALAVFCFARFYYFAFNVIEHYVDGKYRFAGVWSFARHLYSGHAHAAPAQPDHGDSDCRDNVT